MKTILQSPVELSMLSVLAEVAIWDKRPELQRLFASLGKNESVDTAAVAKMLPGLSETGYHNIVRNLEHLRLTDASGAVTALGKHCAQTGDAPAWELGVFTFVVARHPCFGTWLLGFRRENAGGLERDYDGLVDQPTWFQPTPERAWASAFGDKTQFTVAAFPGLSGQSRKCRETVCRASALLKWKLDLATGLNSYWLEGTIAGEEGQSQRFQTEEHAVPESEIVALYAAWEPLWSSDSGRVLMAYDGAASEDGHDDFLRSLSYQNVTAGRRGTYPSAKVEGIPVGPTGVKEARTWAISLALSRVARADRYVTPAAWTEVWQKTIDGTPLAPKAGAPPDLAQLAVENPRIVPRTRWLLAAAADLLME